MNAKRMVLAAICVLTENPWSKASIPVNPIKIPSGFIKQQLILDPNEADRRRMLRFIAEMDLMIAESKRVEAEKLRVVRELDDAIERRIMAYVKRQHRNVGAEK
jgi:hypothetical protein